MVKSINFWSFPASYSIGQCMDKAVKAGFQAVEPNIVAQGELSFSSPDSKALEVKRMAEDRGLALASLSTGAYWDVPPTHDDPAVRRRALELLRRQLETAALLGVGAVLVVPGLVGADFIPGSPVVQYDRAYDRALEFITAAVPHAQSCGVAIGVENVWNKLLLSLLEMRAFIDSCDSPFVRAYFDIGNVLSYGYPEHWIRILGSRIVRVHIKDFRTSVGNINGFTDLLSGDVNFPEVMQALTEIGYDGFVTAEMGGYKYYTDQIVNNTSAAMDRILAMKQEGNNMLRAAVIGLGFMGRGHVENYRRLEAEGVPVKLVAVCDIEPGRLEGRDIATGNIDVGSAVGLSDYVKYTNYREMFNKEKLDYVDIALPTHLHAEAACAAMEAGLHVLSEKPMARTVEQCGKMIETAQSTGRLLMTAQCLRFWPAYEYLKECVDTGRFGKVISAYFFRGGSTPRWSWQNWLLQKELSGGCLLDQHVHDVDVVNWLFGTPEAVSTNWRNVIPGSGYDAVSTRYLYADGKIVSAEDDWTINGKFGFEMLYRVNFEHGSVHFNKGVVAYPEEGDAFEPELSCDDGYYREIRYFIECLRQGGQPDRCSPSSTLDTIAIAQAEQASADQGGALVPLSR